MAPSPWAPSDPRLGSLRALLRKSGALTPSRRLRPALLLTAPSLRVRKTSEGETGVGSTYDLTTVFKGSESQMM